MEDTQLKKAAQVWNWITGKKDDLIAKRKKEGLDCVAVKPTEIIQDCVAGCKKVDNVMPILALLEERNYLRKEIIKKEIGRNITLYHIRPLDV